MTRAFILALAALAGCANNGAPTGTPDMALGKRPPTDHEPLWQLASGSSRQIIAAPEVYTVTWPNDPFATRNEAFVSWLLGSDYWASSLKEYGVGKGKSMGVVTLPAAQAPTKLAKSDFDGLVKLLIANGSVPNPSSNTHLAFFVPATTVVTESGLQSCVPGGLAGFHEMAASTPPVTFSVILECIDPDMNGTVFDSVTKAASHEIAEAATDPTIGGGYVSEQGEEVSDLCNFNDNLTFDAPGDATHPPARYWVQRQYSFAAAKMGNMDPCLPLPFARPFFGVTTKPGLLMMAAPTKSAVTTTALLEPFAYGDVGKMHWQVISSAFDVEPFQGTVEAGDTINLVVTVPPGTPPSFNEIDISIEAQNGGSFTWPFYLRIQ